MFFVGALVASLALEASAFLVPQEIAEAVDRAKSDLSTLLASSGDTLILDCPGCPFFGADDNSNQLQTGIENKLRLKFTVDEQRDLILNDRPVLILDPTTVITARQIRVEDGQETDPVPLDFTWERVRPVVNFQQPEEFFHSIHFTILALQGHPVQVDTVSINLLHTADLTSIVSISTIPFKDTPGATSCDPASKWSLCRFRAIFASRLQAFMEAAKSRTSAAKGWVKGKGKGCGGRFGRFGPPKAMAGVDVPSSQGHHLGMGMDSAHYGHHDGMRMGESHHRSGHHHHRHAAHNFGHMLHQTLRFFVIPALLGVIGGLMASVIGMLVGQAISYLWRRFRRSGRHGHVRNIHVVEIVIDKEEKDALILSGIDSRDLPPPPEYRDIEASIDERAH